MFNENCKNELLETLFFKYIKHIFRKGTHKIAVIKYAGVQCVWVETFLKCW